MLVLKSLFPAILLCLSSPIETRVQSTGCLMERVTATTAAILTTLVISSFSSNLSLALSHQIIMLSRRLTVYTEKKREGKETRRIRCSRTANRTVRYRRGTSQLGRFHFRGVCHPEG